MPFFVSRTLNYEEKLRNASDTYSRANDRVTGERTGVQGSSHSGTGLISSGAGFAAGRDTCRSRHDQLTARRKAQEQYKRLCLADLCACVKSRF